MGGPDPSNAILTSVESKNATICIASFSAIKIQYLPSTRQNSWSMSTLIALQRKNEVITAFSRYPGHQQLRVEIVSFILFPEALKPS